MRGRACGIDSFSLFSSTATLAAPTSIARCYLSLGEISVSETGGDEGSRRKLKNCTPCPTCDLS
jgi:hypothetical protein